MYILSKLFAVALMPSILLLLMSVIGLLLTLRRLAPRWANRFLVIGIGGLVVLAVLPVGTWMLRPLEDRFPIPNPMPDRVDGIIVLGGAISVDRSLDRGQLALNEAAGRMATFTALAYRYPRARLVFSGGNADPFVVKKTEAEIARNFFQAMGLERRGILYESNSRNTYENALYSLHLVRPKPEERWLLVTSAADLPRAMGCFRAVGWSVIPVPGEYRTFQGRSGFMPGLARGSRMADWAAHEWIGLVYYRLRGWTSSLFPGPV